MPAALALTIAGALGAQADDLPTPAHRLEIADHVREAAQRFAIPEQWIYAVIRAESAGRIHAVSSAGAMGLMQLMPGTWAHQRARYGLGTDPFDPRDNILAGTSYLREMLDRFGWPGCLAAYNAGPGRYRDWLAGRRPLPPETRRYVARIASLVRGGRGPATSLLQPEAAFGSSSRALVGASPMRIGTGTRSPDASLFVHLEHRSSDLFAPVSAAAGQ